MNGIPIPMLNDGSQLWPHAGISLGGAANNMVFAGNLVDPGNSFHGTIDDVRVFIAKPSVKLTTCSTAQVKRSSSRLVSQPRLLMMAVLHISLSVFTRCGCC